MAEPNASSGGVETVSHVHVPFLLETMIFLGAVVLIVPLCRALRVSPILGFLAVGALAAAFNLVEAESVRSFAELGVIFLLFTIGLELSFDRLRAFSKLVFGLGAAQVGLSALVIGVVAYLWGNSIEASMVIGLCLALSSTAMVMQLLTERGEIAARHGRASFAVLLFQDLAVVPILMLVTVFGAQETAGGAGVVGEVALAIGRAILAVAVILVLGRFVLRYLFRLTAQTRSVEVFMAMTLLAVLGTSYATGVSGLSMALGAFLAGLLLAETEFRHQIESDIEPFKGLLLGLFFAAVGMSLDFAVVADKALLLFVAVVGLVALKTVIAAGLARLFGLPWHVAARTGILLGEAGEFAFVVIGLATSVANPIMSDAVGQFMVIVAGLSMALTPGLAAIAGRVGKALEPKHGRVESHNADMEQLTGHVVIAGFGRVGQTVAAILREDAVPYVALDMDPARVKRCRAGDEPVYYGDAAKPDVLQRVGAERALAMLITLDDPKAAGRAVQAARHTWPKLKIIVRARDTAHSDELKRLGADEIVPETLEASLQMAGLLLRATGAASESVGVRIDDIRRREYPRLTKVIDTAVAQYSDGDREPADKDQIGDRSNST